MADGVIGREAEIAAIDDLLAGIDAGSRLLVIEGEPGIGKSTVWREVFRLAAGRPLRILSCRPVEAEAKLAFASLADLLEPVADEWLPELPEPQRLALEVALLRTRPRGAAPDPRAVGTAVFSLLSRLASTSPVVIAVDDVQWLDRASAGTLAFSLRRLANEKVGVLAALRLDQAVPPDALGLTQAEPERVRRVRLAPLSLSALHHVIRTHLGHVLPRPTLVRIEQTSGGNPLFALELARALIEASIQPAPGDPLPVPDTLMGLVSKRVARLSPEIRKTLLAAALLSKPTTEVIGFVVGSHATSALVGAERAGVIEVRSGVCSFSHPLLASAVVSSAGAEERQMLHRKLADAVEEPEEVARHLALGADRPDEAVALGLERAAVSAASRGSPETAAELMELACALTPTEMADQRANRRLELTEYLFKAGDAERAQNLLERLIEEQPMGLLRARALELTARILYVAGTPAAAAARCEEALPEARGDVELQARIHATLSLVSYHDFRVAGDHARKALDLLEKVEDPDPVVLSEVLVAFAGAENSLGHGIPMDIVQRGLDLERISPAPSVSDRMSAALGAWLKYSGDFDGARHWLEATHRAAIEEGDEGSLPYALSHLPQLELWTGRWRAAEQRALEHFELAERTGQSDQLRQALYNLSFVHAHQGRTEEARAEAERLKGEAENMEDLWSAGNAYAVLGFVELSCGDTTEALRHLSRNAELRDALGSLEPNRTNTDFAEALVENGELDRAEKVLRTLETRARVVGWSATLANAARCRGLVAAARGDLAGAVEALEEALVLHDSVDVPFDRARTLLVLGQVRRRRTERRAARDALERAQAIFEELGAPIWAERAAAENRRVPIRREAGDELTPGEERIAELAAAGRTNREVARTLFMSPKTVEANLSRVYRKLGIRSRAELGTRMAERRAVGHPAPKM